MSFDGISKVLILPEPLIFINCFGTVSNPATLISPEPDILLFNSLDDKTFQKFSKLREIRKKVAADEAIPAYAVFTDEELAGLAKLESITQKSMLSVKGIGDKKVERFAKYFITKIENDEKTGVLN